MPGFDSLKQAIPLGTALAPMTPEETKFDGNGPMRLRLVLLRPILTRLLHTIKQRTL